MLKTIALMAVVAVFVNATAITIYSQHENKPQLERVGVLWCI